MEIPIHTGFLGSSSLKVNLANDFLTAFLGFITGVQQTHARKYQIAIDKISFAFKIFDFEKDQTTSKPQVEDYL